MPSGEGGQYRRVIVPPGFNDINGPSLCYGALYQGGAEDDIHLLVLYEGAVLWWVFPLYFSLRGLSPVEDELSEISLINQILEVSSESLAFDGEMTHPVIEDVIPGSGSIRVL